MPVIYREAGFVFKFYSNENHEPPHVHIVKGGGNAKFWLLPIEEAYAYGFTTAERRLIKSIVKNNVTTFVKNWNDYFNE